MPQPSSRAAAMLKDVGDAPPCTGEAGDQLCTRMLNCKTKKNVEAVRCFMHWHLVFSDLISAHHQRKCLYTDGRSQHLSKKCCQGNGAGSYTTELKDLQPYQ